MRKEILNPSYLKILGGFFSKIVKAILSGFPRGKILIKPVNVTILRNPKDSFKPDSEKHYHRPKAKPTVEKQTLLKERKKTKAKH
ncbi:MAG: hypothetical protein K9H64_09990 [Bacteroidales bacterium]|nr:hypothetical protein [Bacteroidales bacterium]MCF8456198.1 hypothetical protein [Bacteroidales bacterium]